MPFWEGFLPVHITDTISEWSEIGSSAANTAQTVTRAAEAGKTHHVTSLSVIVTGGDLGLDLEVTIKDDTTTVWKTFIPAADANQRIQISFPHGLAITEGNALNVDVGAAGLNLTTHINLAGYTV